MKNFKKMIAFIMVFLMLFQSAVFASIKIGDMTAEEIEYSKLLNEVTPSYIMFGDGQTTYSGESATVRAGFYQDHNRLEITLTDSFGNIIDYKTRRPISGNAYVTYTTPILNTIGVYTIRYHCSDNPDTKWDDFFTIYVINNPIPPTPIPTPTPTPTPPVDSEDGNLWYKFDIEIGGTTREALLHSKFNGDESALKHATALVKGYDVWKQYEFIDNKWIETPYIYDVIPNIGPVFKYEEEYFTPPVEKPIYETQGGRDDIGFLSFFGIDSIEDRTDKTIIRDDLRIIDDRRFEKFISIQKISSSKNYKEKKVELNYFEDLLAGKYLSNIGINYSDLDPNDKESFNLGVKVGIDDNLLFGLQQFFGILKPYYEDYYFINGKIQTDAVFMILYSEISRKAITMAGVNAAEAFGKAAGGLALAATGAGAPAGVILSGAAVKDLAETAGLVVISTVAATAAYNSGRNLLFSVNAEKRLSTNSGSNFNE